MPSLYDLNEIPDHLKGYFEPAPQIGLEETPEAYVSRLVGVFREVRRVLKDDGTCWINLGDSYHATQRGTSSTMGGKSSTFHGQTKQFHPTTPFKLSPTGLKPKDLVGIPWRVAFALQADGWYLRQDIIWHKPNPMPESVRDRCTKAHEYIFLLSKSPRYWFDHDEMMEPFADARGGCPGGGTRLYAPESRRDGTDSAMLKWNADGGAKGRNKRTVWTVTTKPYKEAHFATFPPDLIRPCVRAGCPAGGTVLDPFAGAGTTGLVALEEGRDFLGIELNPEYVGLIEKRLAPLLAVATLDQFAEAEV